VNSTQPVMGRTMFLAKRKMPGIMAAVMAAKQRAMCQSSVMDMAWTLPAEMSTPMTASSFPSGVRMGA